MQQIRWAVLLMVVMGTLAACQGNPPTVVYVVVTPTSAPEAASDGETPAAASPVASASNTEDTQTTPTNLPVATLSQPTETVDPSPTDTVAQAQVAEQVYENGRMMWVQPVSQIWVMVNDNENGGRWLRYTDTFVEGEPETDPSLTPPDGMLQPERGFGKLWRENENIKEALGWALTPEFGYISQYEYHPGNLLEDGITVAEGEHKLFSLYGEAFIFHEDTQTWELGS